MQIFKNYYCDSVSCSLGEFIDVYKDFIEEDILKKLSSEDVEILCDYAAVKNKLQGVKELNLKVPYAGCGIKSLEKFGLLGKEIISARQMNGLSAKDFIGGRLMLMIEDILDYNESFLSEVSDFLAKADMSIIISLGRDLKEVGKLVNRYNKSPVRVLEDFGFLDRECYVYGLNFIDKEDQKLLAEYKTPLILSPRSDGEEGRGTINLFNFVYNHLKFVFSSGKCYNIDMLGEAKLAQINTNNLMYERGLVKDEELLSALEISYSDLGSGENEVEKNILDKKIVLQDENLRKSYKTLQEKVKEIVKRIKE